MLDTDNETREVDLDRLASAGDDVVVVYVRGVRSGHVSGAVLMPMAQLPSRMAALAAQHAPPCHRRFWCHSEAMTGMLRDAGFDVGTVVGGTRAWIQSGRPAGMGPMTGE